MRTITGSYRHRRRLRVAAVGGLLLVVPLVSSGWAAAAPKPRVIQCTTGAFSLQSGWVRIAGPHFARGGTTLTGYAVKPSLLTSMVATNGTVIEQSADAGCHWSQAYALPSGPSAAAPYTADTALITSLRWAPDGRVYAVITAPLHPDVLASTDDGRTWAEAGSGINLPADPEGPAPLLATSDRAGTVYLLEHVVDRATTVPVEVLYATTDGGASWSSNVLTLATYTHGPGTTPFVNDMTVQPGNAKRVWLATDGGLYESTDSGSDWKINGIGGSDAMRLVAADVSDTGKSAVTTFEEQQALGYYSLDLGLNWSPTNTPAAATSVAVLHPTPDMAVSTSDGLVFRYDPAADGWKQIWSGPEKLGQLSSNNRGVPTLFACTCGSSAGAIWVYVAGSPLSSVPTYHPPKPPAEPKGGQCIPDPPAAPKSATWEPSSLAPGQQRIELAAGQSRTVHYQFHAAPRVLAAFFLEDNGTRAEFYQCPFMVGTLLAAGRLAQARNFEAGLGSYGDYYYPGGSNITVGTGDTASSLYYRYIDIGPVGQAFVDMVSAINGGWGGGTVTHTSGDQGGLGAMYQAATGAGQDVAPPGRSSGDLTGGMQADFGPDAYRVIVNVAGDWMNDPDRSSGYPGPSFATVESTLRDQGIHQVGIWVDNSQNKENQGGAPYDGMTDVMTVARASDATSPTNIDCQDQGAYDIRTGDPLVCTYFAIAEDVPSIPGPNDPAMGFEMSKLLLALKDPEPMRLQVLSGGHAVARISPAVVPGLDYLLPHSHGFDVTYRCGPNDIGTTTLASVGGSMGRWMLATANATVICGAPTPRPPHILAALPPVPPPPPVPLTIPNPQPAPNPGPNVAPNPAPNPQQVPQAQPQGVPQGVVVNQVQEEPQLAVQQARTDQLPQEEAMTAYRMKPRDPYRGLRWAGGGLALCMLMAYGLVQRTTQRAYSSTRRRRRDA